jgi:hypothetical protein
MLTMMVKIPPISTKQTITCHHKTFNINNTKSRRHVVDQGPGLSQEQQYGWVKPINVIPTLPLLIIGYPTERQISTIKKHAELRFLS